MAKKKKKKKKRAKKKKIKLKKKKIKKPKKKKKLIKVKKLKNKKSKRKKVKPKAKKTKIKKKLKISKEIKSKNTKDPVFKVSPQWAKMALVNNKSYKKMYEESVLDNEKFWEEHGKRINWIKPYTKIKDVTYSKEKVDIKWFYDGT